MSKNNKEPAFEAIHGDCVEAMRLLAPGIVDLAICDWPYNIGVGYLYYEDSKPRRAYLKWCSDVVAGIRNTLTATGSLWLFCPSETVADIDVMCRNQHNLYMRDWVAWGFGFGVHCEKKFSRCHAHILHYSKHRTKFTFNKAAVAVPSDRQTLYKDKRAVAGGKTPGNVWALTREQMDRELPAAGDVWYESRICGTFGERQAHCPNQIPQAVLDRIILATSNPGELVMDPCAGTFSAGVASLRHGRRFIGMDIDATSVKAGLARMEKLATEQVNPVQPGLFDKTTKQKRKKK